MNFFKILWKGILIGIIMMILQILSVNGSLDNKELYLFKNDSTSPLNVEPFNDTVKSLLVAPTDLYKKIESLEPTKSQAYIGIQGLTGANKKDFLRFLIYFTTFLYFFGITVVFAKVSTIFHTEKDQVIFFYFLFIIYFVVINILGRI